MPYDEGVAELVRTAVANVPIEPTEWLSERKMFGGICILVNGKMLVGVSGSRLIIRLGDEQAEEALNLPYVQLMDFTGRPLKNFLYVDAAGLTSEEEYAVWVERSLEYVRTRIREDVGPPKSKRRRRDEF